MESENTFAPELILSESERADLAVVRSMPGFTVIQKIFRSSLDTFTLALLNAPEDSEEMKSRHRSAKVVAQLYTSFIDRVNQEVEVLVKTPRWSDPPLDPTSVLDMDYPLPEIEIDLNQFI